MSNTLGKLQHELEAAQRALAEAEARFSRMEAEHQTAVKEFENIRMKIEQAHREWMASLDVVADPIFLHDKNFRILRCNRAYQQCAGIPFKQIIGQLYYEVFPKSHAPLPNCLQAQEKAEADSEILIGDTTYRSRAYAVRDKQGSYLYSIHTLENINKHLRSQRELQGSEERYRRLFEASKDGILILDAETGKLIDANPAILDLLSYSFEELTGKALWEIRLITDIEASKRASKELLSKEYVRYEDLPLKSKDGRSVEVEFVSNLYEVGDRKVIQCHIRDISERLRAQKELQESELQYRRLFESAKDGILILDAETGKIIDANPFILDLLSYSFEELTGKALWEIGLITDIEASKRASKELLSKEYVRYENLPLKSKDGRSVEVEFVSNLYEVGDRKVIQCNVRDITESLRAREMLIASHDLLKNVMENTPVRVFWKDTDLRYLGCNTAFAHDAGMSSPEDLIGKDDFQMGWKEQAERYRADDRQVMDSGIPVLAREEPQTTPDGNTIWLRTSKVPLSAADGRVFGMLGIYMDITESKRAEKLLIRANRALRTLSAGNEALVRATSEDKLLQEVVNIIVQQSGYEWAMVCYADDNPEQSITLMAWSGTEEKYFWVGHPTWANTEEGQLPVSSAIRSGMTQIRRDIASESKFAPWRDEALARGYVSNIAHPLTADGRTFGALSIYSSDVNAFDKEEIQLLEELAKDLAYGVVTLRTRLAHEQQAAILLASMEQSIQTIAATVETRDPYTAGHQRRVSELATAIAQEIGLPKDQVNGIHLAAIIHDLGKIHIPAEILAKPGKLTDIEFMFIKTHPQEGYNILKNVNFPWPIADIIRQHHERLDGSGYPQGLKGDQILLESRILAVADVMEAMSSHRPYRAALGIKSALNEIRRGRGSAYDPTVVDVCMKLFAEKRFAFSTH